MTPQRNMPSRRATWQAAARAVRTSRAEGRSSGGSHAPVAAPFSLASVERPCSEHLVTCHRNTDPSTPTSTSSWRRGQGTQPRDGCPEEGTGWGTSSRYGGKRSPSGYWGSTFLPAPTPGTGALGAAGGRGSVRRPIWDPLGTREVGVLNKAKAAPRKSATWPL